jgi:hypothetical protein
MRTDSTSFMFVERVAAWENQGVEAAKPALDRG